MTNLEQRWGRTLRASTDPSVKAFEMIEGYEQIFRFLDISLGHLRRSCEAGRRQLRNLRSIGSHHISAPDVLGGEILRNARSVRRAADEVVGSIEDVVRDAGKEVSKL